MVASKRSERKKKVTKKKDPEASTRTTKAREDIDVEAQDYYQGLIAKEDLDGILEESGDFVVRMDCKPGELSKYVLCVYQKFAEGEEKKGDVKEFVIGREGKQFTLGSGNYDGIVPLIDDLFNKKTQLPKDGDVELLLTRGVPRPSWELKHEFIKYNEDDVLGSGQFGKVFKGQLCIKAEGKPVKVAIKVATNDEDHKTLADTLKEARAMRNIDHPNIIKFYGIVIERDPVMLVIELVNQGALIGYLKKNGPLPEAQKHKFALQAAWGIEYLHKKRVIHRDIAARNCLLNKPKEDEDEIIVKIADFGLSRVGEFYKVVGKRTLPIKYLPYESFTKGMFNSQTDAWMFGALLFEIYSDGGELYEGQKLSKVKERIGNGDLQEMPEGFPKEAVELIGQCWQKEPKDRITMKAAAEVLEKITSMNAPVVCDADMVRKKAKVAESERRTVRKKVTTKEKTEKTEKTVKSKKA